MKSIFYYLVQITELLEMLLAKVFAKKNPDFKYYSNLENNSEFLKPNILI